MRKLAKRPVSPDLVCPDHWTGPDYVYTDGPAVADLNAAAGFAPDPQQELGLDLIFAVGENGLPATFAFCVVCCRQNLKTGLLKQASVGWLYVTEERRITWSAHELDTTRDAQKDLAELIEDSPALSKRLAKTSNHGIYDANGQMRIELDDGRMIKFKARTLTGGRGLSGDKTILDEAFALKPAHVGSLLPTMAARPHGQVLYASSAGKADSSILLDVRDRGRSGASPRLTYLEWLAEKEPCRRPDPDSDDPESPAWVEDPECKHPKDAPARGLDCALDREHLRRKANPTLTTGRITLQTLDDLRQELPPEEYARECLGWWDEVGDFTLSIFPGWPGCGLDPTEPPPVKALGIAVSIDQAWTSFAAAGLWEGEVENPDLDEAARAAAQRVNLDAVDRRPDSEWAPAEAKRIQDEHGCAVVIDEKCPDPDLITRLRDAGVDLTVLTLEDVIESTANLTNRVKTRTVTHMKYPELDDAVRAAAWRYVGDRKVVGRKQSGGDVDMLEAGIVALHGALHASGPLVLTGSLMA